MNEEKQSPEQEPAGDKPPKIFVSVIYCIISLIILYVQYYLFFIKNYNFHGSWIPGLYFVLFIPIIHTILSTSLEADLIISVVITFILYWAAAFILGLTGEDYMTESQQLFYRGLLISPIFYSIFISIYFRIPQKYK